ncbi:MAG: PEP-CTERM sorting domain-containing protein [Phycisphaerales bacterium]
MRRVLIPVAAIIAVAATFSSVHSTQAAVLFADDFTGQAPGAPANWMYGVAPPAAAVPAGVTYQVENVDPGAGVDEVLHFNVGTASASGAYDYHTNNRFDFNATGDKIVRLDVDMNILQINAQYRIGIYNAPATTGQGDTRGAYQFRILPYNSTNNVNLLTFTADGASVIDNSNATAGQSLLTGKHTFSLVVDFTGSLTAPLVTAYIDNTQVHQLTAGTNGGFDWADAVTLGVMTRIGQGSSAANVEYDNWNLHTIPEPASLGLMALGGLLIASRTR